MLPTSKDVFERPLWHSECSLRQHDFRLPPCIPAKPYVTHTRSVMASKSPSPRHTGPARPHKPLNEHPRPPSTLHAGVHVVPALTLGITLASTRYCRAKTADRRRRYCYTGRSRDLDMDVVTHLVARIVAFDPRSAPRPRTAPR